MRLGIVGCGLIGAAHALALRGLATAGVADVELGATFDIDWDAATRLAGESATACASLEELVDRVDAVWVCSWTGAHEAAVEAAVRRALPVFCEKPLATDLASARRVAAALEHVPHQVGLVLRHAPVFAALRDEVASGSHGPVLAVVFRDEQYFPIQGLYASDWRADVARAGGGTLLEHSIHDVDLLRVIVGEPVEVVARTAGIFGHAGIDDSVAVTFTYPNGAHASLTSVWHQITSRGSTRHLEVFCERAMLWTDDDDLGPLRIETDEGTRSVAPAWPAWADAMGLPSDFLAPIVPYAREDAAFLSRLAAGGSGEPSAADALRAHELVALAYSSAAGAPRPAAAR